MNSIAKRLTVGIASLLLHASLPADTETPLTIATASPAGVYHVVGRALCRTLSTPCRAQPSDGSSANLRALRRGELAFALAQSDLHQYATQGIEGFRQAGADTALRSVFSLHSEPFTLVVRRDADIASFEDLQRRSVNIGNPGSGQRSTMLRLMDARGWSRSTFRQVHDLPADQQSMELCHGNIEAMVYTVGHPNSSVAQAIRLCNAEIVDVSGNTIDLLVNAYHYFSYATIPAGLYGPDQPEVHTFGVKATLVTRADVDADQVYRLVSEVFGAFTRFKATHPALGVLTPQVMIEEGLSAPLHDGALRYYRERGWVHDEALLPVRHEIRRGAALASMAN
ncbi:MULTISPECIES: TAXI family TRAP transporter solute-binding subunit [unclassified Halomonas]|uniref:TAXI family TRAP transporter solute-binding subunit n=1 Tax=unclassified Halomonas TaxID=2609666 RepID=UPI002884C00B|nr:MULTISPECIES: TAXI family TRAP transporter solute-binding subunit [unclassified Halomonas]MDT0500375.1 TAXI family TRAP transporter solute-binding subunit [Halomonas sp. PAR7]MDT0511128.1 TAXI family TRAP transporter solute-binding subunit [Halomonas sp. LES1]MDT0593143.1 TAXI family TRAP transporter solute-binding subunit [Halomonas sp. PAR8]